VHRFAVDILALFAVFSEKTSAMSASASTTSEKNSTAAAAALQTSMQMTSVGHLRTQQSFDACSSNEHTGQSHSISGASALQQKLCSAPKNFNNIFKTPDLELTDADLEFSLT